jgi:hypothetical protein
MIKSGEFKPFTGPIKDNKGNIAVPANHSLTDVELAKVNWYVEGITRRNSSLILIYSQRRWLYIPPFSNRDINLRTPFLFILVFIAIFKN